MIMFVPLTEYGSCSGVLVPPFSLFHYAHRCGSCSSVGVPCKPATQLIL